MRRIVSHWLTHPAARIALLYVLTDGLWYAFGRVFNALPPAAQERLPLSDYPADCGIYIGEMSKALCVVLALAMMRLLGDRDIPWRAWFSLHGLVRQSLAGLTLMAASVLLQVRLLRWAGLYWLNGWQRPTFLWLDPAFLALVAFAEETMFRGYFFRKIEAWGGPWRALLLSSALFGLTHITNPQPNWEDRAKDVFDAFAGGLLYGVAYLLTRRLWLPMALHFMWNFSVYLFFGASPFGKEWGGVSFGAGGVAAQYWLQQAFTILITLALLLLVVRRERWRKIATGVPEEHAPIPVS